MLQHRLYVCLFAVAFYAELAHVAFPPSPQDAFLPLGYPDSVSKDYLAYQKWDTMQVRGAEGGLLPFVLV